MKIRKKSDALTVASQLAADGHTVEWVRKNYGAQRELTWNIRLADGSEISHLGGENVSERSLTQITREIEDHANKIRDLQLSLKSHQDDLVRLLTERNEIESELLGAATGMRLQVVSTRDQLPLVTRRARQASSEGPDTKTLKAWAADQDWSRKTGIKIPERGRIPNELKLDYGKPESEWHHKPGH